MSFWDDIVNKATLGSAKMPVTPADLPQAITEAYNISETGEAEEDFLRIAAFAYQYRQSGTQPVNLATVAVSEAAAETKPYCDPRASLALKHLLAEEHQPFLDLWLRLCASKNLCVHPELLPDLFEAVSRKPGLHTLAAAVAGNRGEWLLRHNPRWALETKADDDVDTWETGKPEARRALLQQLRETSPADGLALMQSTWTSESANDKVAFLEVLKTGAATEDLAWLESLNEKGAKVKTALLDVLKTIPESAVSRQYREIIKRAFSIKTGKSVLGIGGKKSLAVDDAVPIPDAIFKTGIEKVSSIKNVSDFQHILAQIIVAIEPAFWTKHLGETTQGVVQLFAKDRQTAFFLPAIAHAAVATRDTDWASTLLDHASDDLPTATIAELISTLKGKDKEAYVLKFFPAREAYLIELMTKHHQEAWSMEMTKTILKYTAQEVYAYNKVFYRQAAPFIPVALLGNLDQFIPADDIKKSHWRTQSDELSRLLMLKQQTLQYFTA